MKENKAFPAAGITPRCSAGVWHRRRRNSFTKYCTLFPSEKLFLIRCQNQSPQWSVCVSYWCNTHTHAHTPAHKVKAMQEAPEGTSCADASWDMYVLRYRIIDGGLSKYECQFQLQFYSTNCLMMAAGLPARARGCSSVWWRYGAVLLSHSRLFTLSLGSGLPSGCAPHDGTAKTWTGGNSHCAQI